MFAIKVNENKFIPNYNMEGLDRILTFNTEKQAMKKMEFILKGSTFTNLKVVEVEERIYIDPAQNISIQRVTELNLSKFDIDKV